MCMSAPSVPSVPERQAAKLPDQGAADNAGISSKFRRAILAGLITSPQGVLGSPTVSKPTLG